MKLIGYGIALAVIVYVLLNISKDDTPQDAIPEGYKRSMEKAEQVEQTLQDAAQKQLEELDSKEP
jgi:hypothetical protein